jgi:hypothetical protein
LNLIQKLYGSNKLELFQILTNKKKGPSLSQKIEIKYGLEGFEERNNFLHGTFSIFKFYFE